MFFLNAYWNVGYGVWTILQINAIVSTPHTSTCKIRDANLLQLNYEVLIIFGVFPALITLFCFAVGVLCCPYITYILFMNQREEFVQNQAT